MPLTFTFAPGFLEAPDEAQEDVIKLAKLVVAWWKRENYLVACIEKLFKVQYAEPEMVQLARKILEKERGTKNIL